MRTPLLTRRRLAGVLAIVVAAVALPLLSSSDAVAATTLHKLNFQAAGAPTPAGFTAETGAPYDLLRGHGWTRYAGDGDPVDMAHGAFTRNGGANARLDTGIDMTPTGRSWGRFQVAAVPGRYRFWVTVGDPATTADRQRLEVEGMVLVDWTQTSDMRTRTFEVVVDVLDGMLTLHPAGGADTSLLAMTVQRLDPGEILPLTPPVVPDVEVPDPEIPDVPDPEVPDVPDVPDVPLPPGVDPDVTTTLHKLNFQEASAPTPAGFTPEPGAPFDPVRGHGWTRYDGSGESLDLSHGAFTRNGGAHARLDTGIDMTPTGRSWGRFEVLAAPGRYRFWVTVGDRATTNVRQLLEVEGMVLVDWTQTSGERTRTFEIIVDVFDGLLTLHPAGGADTALLAMTVQRLGDGSLLDLTPPPFPDLPDVPPIPGPPPTPDPAVPTDLPVELLGGPNVPTFEEPPPLPPVNIWETMVQLGLTDQPGPNSGIGLPPLATPAETDPTVGGIAGIAPGAHFPYMHVSLIEREMALMEEAGTRWLRMPFTWIAMEPQPGEFNFSKNEVIARMAHDHGIQIIANVAYSPKWARPYGCTIHSCAPDDNADYVRFFEHLVDHFLPLGVRHFEIWNEPNMQLFWSPKPDMDQYADLVIQTYREVKPKHPTAFILAGSTSPAKDLKNGNQINPLTFLEGLLDRGVAGHFDGYSHHPYSYPAAPDAFAPWHGLTSVVPAMNEILADHGMGHIDIWTTEFSYHTAVTGGGVSEAKQAEYVARTYEQWQKVSDAPLIWFNLRDRGTNDHDREHKFGILHKNWKPKPAWEAWKTAMAHPQSG